MKSIGISASAVFLASLIGSAVAADLAQLKSPPVLPPPPPLWAGFYFGANIGAAISSGGGIGTSSGPMFNDFAGASSFAVPTFFGAASAVSAASNVSSSGVGVIGGGQVGYNWQFAERFVGGIEADIQGLTLQTDVAAAGVGVEPVTGIPLASISHLQKSLSYLGTVRGRVGYLVTPTLLVFGTGGLAYGNPSLSVAVSQVAADPNGFVGNATASSNHSNTQVGWTVGGGLEWMFKANWSAKVEYLYYSLGSISASTVLAGNDNVAGVPLYSSGIRSSSNFSGNIVRAGLNYHFESFAPATVVAKY